MSGKDLWVVSDDRHPFFSGMLVVEQGKYKPGRCQHPARNCVICYGTAARLTVHAEQRVDLARALLQDSGLVIVRPAKGVPVPALPEGQVPVVGSLRVPVADD